MAQHGAIQARGTFPAKRVSVTIVLVAAAVAIGIGAWSFAARSNDSTTPAASSAAAVGPTSHAHAVTAAGLTAAAKALGHPIYWLGPKTGMTYELTITKTGMAYVRYLPKGVAVGDVRPKFITVGTYPKKAAYSTLAAARKIKGSQVQQVAGGALAVTYSSHPLSVYLGWRTRPFVVEVFDPTALAAQTIARYGLVKSTG